MIRKEYNQLHVDEKRTDAMRLIGVLLFGALMGILVYAYVKGKLDKAYRILIPGNILLYLCIYIIEGTGFWPFLFSLTASVLLTLSVVDGWTMEIPLECNVVIGVLGICHLLYDRRNWLEYVIGAGTVSLLFLLVYVITRGQGIGGGDIKLMVAAGLLLGWKKILLALFLGSVMGSVIHLLRIKFQNKESVLAFGPYLAVGIFLSGLFGEAMIHWYLSFFA